MDVRAAVAHKAGAPLTIETVQLDGPRAGEVLVEIKATGVCHTDAFTLSGDDPEGIFPAILGHEGAGVIVEVGAGVTSVKPGDHVIPLYTPECRQCEYCTSGKTNLCQAIRETQGRGVMPDGSSRFKLGGEPKNAIVERGDFRFQRRGPVIGIARVGRGRFRFPGFFLRLGALAVIWGIIVARHAAFRRLDRGFARHVDAGGGRFNRRGFRRAAAI